MVEPLHPMENMRFQVLMHFPVDTILDFNGDQSTGTKFHKAI